MRPAVKAAPAKETMMDALPPSPPAEVQHCTPERHCLVRVAAWPPAATDEQHAPHHPHDKHVPTTRVVAQTSATTSTGGIVIIAEPDHLEHVVNGASDQIVAELGVWRINGSYVQVYRIG